MILGKTNLSEWANFRSFESVSGWSGRGGQTNNPYGIARNPCGSSSGSAAAVSSNFAAVSFGTETDGSIVCPANANGVVGMKPTVGLTSRPASCRSRTRKTRSVRTAATWPTLPWRWAWCRAELSMAAIRRPAAFRWDGRAGSRAHEHSHDYTQFLNPHGLQGARLGVTRVGLSGFDPTCRRRQSVLDAFEAARHGNDRRRAPRSSTWTRRVSCFPRRRRPASSWCCASSSATTCRRTSPRVREFRWRAGP